MIVVASHGYKSTTKAIWVSSAFAVTRLNVYHLEPLAPRVLQCVVHPFGASMLMIHPILAVVKWFLQLFLEIFRGVARHLKRVYSGC